jgi:hypothetical protein
MVARPALASPRSPVAVSPECRLVLGKTGDNTCAKLDNELLRGQNDVACLL